MPAEVRTLKSVADRLGLRWRWIRWIVNQPPLLALHMPFLLTLGGLFGAAFLLEWRVLDFTKGYRGVYPGDLYVAAGMGVAFLMAIYYLPYAAHRWYCSSFYQWTAAILALAAGCLFTGREIHAMIYDPHGPATYTLAQFISPTHLWHMAAFPLLIELAVAVVIPVLIHARGHWWLWPMKFGIVYCAYGWYQNAIVYDNTHPRPDLNDVHPLNGGWFGGFGLQLWHYLFG